MNGHQAEPCGWEEPPGQRVLPPAAAHPPAAPSSPALDLHLQKERFPEQHRRLSLGCPVLDGLLGGGLPLAGITELAGRSSAGKTQLALQLCLAVQFPRRHGGLEAGERAPPLQGAGVRDRPVGSWAWLCSWPLPEVGTQGRLLQLASRSHGCGMPPGKRDQPRPTWTPEVPMSTKSPQLWAGPKVPAPYLHRWHLPPARRTLAGKGLRGPLAWPVSVRGVFQAACWRPQG